VTEIGFGSTTPTDDDTSTSQTRTNYNDMLFEDSRTKDPTLMTDESDDDDEFMAKVNVYLNERQEDESSWSSPGKALEGILRKSSSLKTVQFAIDEDGLSNPETDASKSKQELLAKITRLTEVLREAENQVAIEQTKRKKKERNLLKLAKELKKRITQHELEQEKIEEVSVVDSTRPASILLTLRSADTSIP
jgi:hypothetical protein